MKKIFVYILTFTVSLSAYAGNGDEKESSDHNGPMKIRKRAARPDIPGTFLIDIGWNLLQSEPSTLELSLMGSRTLNMYYYYDMPIGNSNFVFMPGIGVGLNRFKFDNDVTLVHAQDTDGNDVVAVSDLSTGLAGADIKKSMLIANYIDIPIEFRFYANPDDKKRSFNVSVGGRAGIRFSSHTKLKYELDGENVKTKNKRDFGLNRFRYGLTGRIGIGGFNLFYYHSLSEMFDGGPFGTENTSNITVGLSFTGF
ncbi:hypothetical protein C900_03994 [Fulvivirga imtechensis AK7]|uniref:Outer membrane protein beta-barrel domain-containing protein n=1 Tax=Fulvivirga imtechensis AK7 TaxID=1237149 RepID=L8JS57_9BACT|nr:outer membrane beta-barrel protein [Fulvivirga imtechensis]ELR70309.1 hypothetical protein C900_03994 [Fulvivirga imtechensis AK7]